MSLNYAPRQITGQDGSSVFVNMRVKKSSAPLCKSTTATNNAAAVTAATTTGAKITTTTTSTTTTSAIVSNVPSTVTSSFEQVNNNNEQQHTSTVKCVKHRAKFYLLKNHKRFTCLNFKYPSKSSCSNTSSNKKSHEQHHHEKQNHRHHYHHHENHHHHRHHHYQQQQQSNDLTLEYCHSPNNYRLNRIHKHSPCMFRQSNNNNGSTSSSYSYSSSISPSPSPDEANDEIGSRGEARSSTIVKNNRNGRFSRHKRINSRFIGCNGNSNRISPVKANLEAEINKRLSLPADLVLSPEFLAKLSTISPEVMTPNAPINRHVRRQSLVRKFHLI